MEEWVGELMKMVNPLYAGVRWPRRVERVFSERRYASDSRRW
jgi:hypothetical protein